MKQRHKHPLVTRQDIIEVVTDITDRMDAELEETKCQRDILAAAMRQIAQAYCQGDPTSGVACLCWPCTARAALAEAGLGEGADAE